MCTACQVLNTLHFTYDSVDSADDRVMNVLIMLGMALVYKVHCMSTAYTHMMCMCMCMHMCMHM